MLSFLVGIMGANDSRYSRHPVFEERQNLETIGRPSWKATQEANKLRIGGKPVPRIMASSMSAGLRAMPSS